MEELFLLNSQVIFCWLLFFVGVVFHTQKSTTQSLFATAIDNRPHQKRTTMSSPFFTIIKEMVENKRSKTKIGVGSVVKAKVIKINENTS